MKKFDNKVVIGFFIILFQLFLLLYYSNTNSKKDEFNYIIHNIPVEKAYQFYNEKSAIFIDARYKKFYDGERIEGALSYPLQDYMIWKNKIKIKIKFDQMVIVYCDNQVCSLSYYLSENLRKIGFINVYRLLGGIDQWKEKGYPVHSSS